MAKEKAIAKAINEYYQSLQDFKKQEELMKKKKSIFYALMDSVMNEEQMAVDFESTEVESELVVTKVQKTTVKWNADKLQKTGIADEAIRKNISIINWEGFTKYLKSIGGSAKEVKKFLSVEKQVDTKCLEELELLGAVTKEDLEGCYTANVAAPYYLVKERQK